MIFKDLRSIVLHFKLHILLFANNAFGEVCDKHISKPLNEDNFTNLSGGTGILLKN